MDAENVVKHVSAARRALVTGGAGFLGSHLCERLVAEGLDVLAVDNLATGHVANLDALSGHPRFRFEQRDVTRTIDGRFDLVFNLACCASPIHYQADPVKTVLTCVEGSMHLLDLARRNNARILQASTSEVYGEPEVHPQREDYRGAVNPTGPRACYDEGKRCSETLFFDYHRLHGVQIKVARIFNTYGPRMRLDDGRVVSNLVVQALRNEPMTINGDGSQTRSFCYVDDLIEGFVRLVRTEQGFTGPVNLGNPHEVTVQELAERILEITGSRSRLERKPMPVDDPTRRCPDISLAREALEWTPRVSLDEGLRRTIGWFEQRLVDPRYDDAPLEVARGVA